MDEQDEKNENATENIEENEQQEDTIQTVEDKRNDYAHDDIIEMLRKIEDAISSFETRFDTIEDAISMFVENGAVIRESNDDENDSNSDYSDFLDIDNLDLTL